MKRSGLSVGLFGCVALIGCSWLGPTRDDRVGRDAPSRIVLELLPGPNAFFVGTLGKAEVRAFDKFGSEMAWTAPRRLETSDSSVLRVDSTGAVEGRRVGFAQLRATWMGWNWVRDSLAIAVGYRGVGTVRFSPVEGGCWAILITPTQALEVSDLPSAFKVDGLRVRIAARPRDGGTFCMVGTLAALDSIRRESP